MKVQKKCGILELGTIDRDGHDEDGVLFRSGNGEEMFIPLEKTEVQAIGKEGLLFQNILVTITIEVDAS